MNIEIHKSLREPYDKLIKKADKILNDIKLNIIKLKNKILFLGKRNIDKDKYMVEFNNYKDEIIYYTELIGSYTEENIMINDNPEDSDKLKNLIVSLNQLEIIQFKEFIQDYHKMNDPNFLDKAVNMYVKEIIPKLKEIQELKYKTNYVEHDENGNHVLIQSKYSPEGMIFYDKNADEVVKFITGTKLKKNKEKIKISKSKSIIVDDNDDKYITSKIKSKTLKTTGKTSKTKTFKKKLTISESEPQREIEQVIDADNIVFDSDEETEKELSDVGIEQPQQSQQSQSQPQQQISKLPKRIGKNIVLNEATEAI